MKPFLKPILKPLIVALAATGIFAAATSGAASSLSATMPVNANNGVQLATPIVTGPSAPIAPMTAPNYRAIVQRYGPSVVGINTEETAKASRHQGEDDDAAAEFAPFFPGIPGMPGFALQAPQSAMPLHGEGSGFIVGKDGIILTNAHVVKNADEVVVKLSDRREYKAKVLGSDPASDVAVLKIDAHDLPVVSFGNPDQLRVGDYVLAIGSPFGFEQSATAGIVSAKGRSLPDDAYVPFIQTDVAVNPGNSGGPLFDAGGNVVGINSQIYSETGGYQGLSFAIPIDVAMQVKDQILATGKVSHAQLGVTTQEINQSLADSFKLKQPQGALISNVVPGSAAAKAGLQQGDVILKYNDHVIDQYGELSTRVGMAQPGDKVTLDLWRDGKNVEVHATLAGVKTVASNAGRHAGPATPGRLGVAVRPLAEEEKRESQLPNGVVVEQAGGAAAHAGIMSGDIILGVNGVAVKSVGDLQKMVAAQNGHIALLIQRGADKIFVPVTLG